MSESTTRYHDPLSLRKNGCLWVLASLGIIILASVVPLHRWMSSYGLKIVAPGTILKSIKYAILSYETDYGHYPIPDFDSNGLDVTVRSRGPMVPALLGMKGSSLNPKEIKLIDFPAAKDRKDGLWQDGAEWVISDLWGEPYYILLDIDKDGLIANPEFGPVTSDPKQAEFHEKFPSPEKLPLNVAIYSSGPDRDPKTWRDNVCSWRSR